MLNGLYTTFAVSNVRNLRSHEVSFIASDIIVVLSF